MRNESLQKEPFFRKTLQTLRTPPQINRSEKVINFFEKPADNSLVGGIFFPPELYFAGQKILHFPYSLLQISNTSLWKSDSKRQQNQVPAAKCTPRSNLRGNPQRATHSAQEKNIKFRNVFLKLFRIEFLIILSLTWILFSGSLSSEIGPLQETQAENLLRIAEEAHKDRKFHRSIEEIKNFLILYPTSKLKYKAYQILKTITPGLADRKKSSKSICINILRNRPLLKV